MAGITSLTEIFGAILDLEVIPTLVRLNAGSDPDGGAAGLDLRGTSPPVGQRTPASGYHDAQALLGFLKRQAEQ
jgi:hypothetical protein